jgi:hypothetical protein
MVVSDFEEKGMPYVTGGILQTYFGKSELLEPFLSQLLCRHILAGNC